MTLANEGMTLAEATDEFRKIQQALAAWALASKHLKINAVLVTEKDTLAAGATADLIRMLATAIVSLISENQGENTVCRIAASALLDATRIDSGVCMSAADKCKLVFSQSLNAGEERIFATRASKSARMPSTLPPARSAASPSAVTCSVVEPSFCAA
jgi:hypothetical protein